MKIKALKSVFRARLCHAQISLLRKARAAQRPAALHQKIGDERGATHPVFAPLIGDGQGKIQPTALFRDKADGGVISAEFRTERKRLAEGVSARKQYGDLFLSRRDGGQQLAFDRLKRQSALSAFPENAHSFPLSAMLVYDTIIQWFWKIENPND